MKRRKQTAKEFSTYWVCLCCNDYGLVHIPCLGILENVLGFNPDLAVLLVTKTKTLPWTLKRIQSASHDDNRGYAAEVLSILLQNNRENRLDFGKNDGIEAVLKVLSVGDIVPWCL
jgi:beta-catenin-like protein 1